MLTDMVRQAVEDTDVLEVGVLGWVVGIAEFERVEVSHAVRLLEEQIDEEGVTLGLWVEVIV